jgi:glutamyl-Q tRNA(Asp) synthetase
MSVPAFRFAPSPNGELHLGHAYSALTNARLAQEVNGRFLLRIEDIDTARCHPRYEEAIYRDLTWLGLRWEEPVRRQSDHFDDYRAALEALIDAELVYPAFLSRGEVRALIARAQEAGTQWPRDPDGAPLYPQEERHLPRRERVRRMEREATFAWRLDIDAALAQLGAAPAWIEEGADGQSATVVGRPRDWGDVIIARKDIPTSYHLAVTVDDALQGITHVVRGRDLYLATAIQRVLQELLGLPAPRYMHHQLILGDDGRKLSKSQGDTSLAALRAAGLTPADIIRMVGL